MGLLSFIGDIGSSLIGANSAKKANKTNIALQREQQDWEEEMSNSAMQRRADDLRKAGLNPVLAAGGTGASTPSVAPAQVEATYKDKGNIGNSLNSALMLKAQIANLNANTNTANTGAALNAEKARQEKVTADNLERLGGFDYETGVKTRARQYDTLGTAQDIAKLDVEKKKIENDMSAKQLAQFEKIWPQLLQQATNQAKEGKLNVEALENIASIGGIEAGAAGKILGPIVDILKAIILKRK